MKKLLITFLLIATLGISGVFASEIPVSEINTATNECAVSDRYFNYYLVGDKPVIAVDRFYNNTNLVKINAGSSIVKIWRGNGVMFDCDDWTLISNVVPQKNKLPGGAYIWKSNCTFKIPNYTKVNNPTQVDAQINYTVGYHNKKSGGTSINGKFFYTDSTEDVQGGYFKCYKPFGLHTNTLSSCNSDSFKYGNLLIHTGECLNYRVFRCGDGLVNSPYSSNGTTYTNAGNYYEECDPNDPTHAGWNNNGYTCNASCQLVEAPVGQPDLTIEKEQISTGTMEAGSTVEYKITVKNEGSGTATGVTIYDVLPAELQYISSSISIIPSSEYLFTTGTTQILGTSRTYIRYYNITLSANGTATVYLTGKVKAGYTFDTLRNCASVSGTNIQPEEDCAEVTPPTPPTPTTCTITLSPDTITLGENVTLSYVISGSFYTPTQIYLSGQQLDHGRMPFTVDTPQGSMTIYGDWMANTGIYTFVLQGSSLSGSDFSCTGILNVIDNNTPPPPTTGHGDVSIKKILESVGPFSVGDQIRYKIVAENHGDATVMDSIWDIMPYSVDYLTSSIIFVPDSHQNYTFSTGIYAGSFMFRYDNLSIAPGQKVIIYLTGRINSNFIDEATIGQVNSTFTHFYDGDNCIGYWTNAAMMGNYKDITKNCAYTYTDGTGSTGSGTVTGSCVRFPTPSLIKYQSVRGMDFTRDQLVVAQNEIITYKVLFGNEYGTTMENVTLFDVLPTCVDYIDSSVHGISGYGFSTDTSNSGNTLIYYTGFSLASGQYGYMIVTGRISDSTSCQNTEVYRNYAYLIYSGGYLRSDVVAKRPNILLTKTGDGPHYNLSQPNTFYITVTNNSTGTMYDVALSEVDSWPTFSGCVNYIDWRGTNFTKDTNALVWRYNSPLQPGESISLVISGSIGSEASCIRDYINTVVLTYRDGAGYTGTLYARYPFDVTAGEFARLTKVVDKHKVGINDYVTYTITYTNVGNVDRNTGYTLTDKWPSDVLVYVSSNCSSIATCSETTSGTDIIFTFNSALHPGKGGTLILTGKVKTSRSAYKWNTVILDYSTIFGTGTLDDKDYIEYEEDIDKNCGNGILELNEKCDGGYDRSNRKEGDRFYIINYLDYNRTTQAGDDIAGKGYYCTKSCELRKTSDSSYNIPSCISVDTSISIMENEIFPFWRALWQRDGIKLVHGGSSKSCSNYSTSKNTIINKDTMICTFSVYDGKNHNQADSKLNSRALHTFTVPCFIEKDSDLDTYFIPFDENTCAFTWCVDFDKVAARQAWNVRTLLGSGWKGDTYGEYKLAFEKVEYQYCAQDGTWTSGALYDAICEVNFALTKPYIMQINTSGTPRATSSDFLDKFYDIVGNKIQTDISDVIKVNRSSYNVSTNVQSQITQFKNKYEKLAVSVNNTWGGGVSSLKKVPKQSIYFVKGNGGTLTLSKTDSIVSSPFTIFVEGMDVVIDGSILTNGMVITDKTISFKDSNCTSGGQVVQGIFIALSGFKANESTLNIKTNKAWCHRGNLHVKGVLIGKNINSIVNSKRSQLNSWFQTEIIYRTASDLRAERRNEIIRGASVLIEYNPDVWSKVIPGAEIFTETLDVYRK